MELQPNSTDFDFDYDSGDLCLDFSNSLEWHSSGHPVEHLGDYPTLVFWGERAGIITPEMSAHLRQLATQKADEAAAAYDRAIQLREVLYRIFSQYYRKEEVNPADVQRLNAVLSRSMPHLQVASSTAGFDWKWSGDSEDFDQIIWPVARQAAELLTSEQLDRVRECEDDRGCGYLFIDTTRNHSRRWCSMESCGNRAKARRHYARQRLSP
jgi:predicted RNA-binding Zn ribbon-like protein